MMNSTEQSEQPVLDQKHKPLDAVDQFLDLLARLIARQHMRKQADRSASVNRKVNTNQHPE
jgi:hypothetical protein